jgi:DNA polymerase-1
MQRAISDLLEGQDLRIGFNLAFDVGVILQWFPQFIDRIFELYDQDRMHCAGIAERLREIAYAEPAKHANLEMLCLRYGVPTASKTDSPRLRYQGLLGRPLSDYSAEERDYPLQDADAHLQVYQRIRQRAGALVNDAAVASETRHALWLHLSAAWGLRVDAGNLDALRKATVEAVAVLREQAQRLGFLRANGKRNMLAIKEHVARAYEGALHPPLTDTGLALKKKGQPWTIKHVATDKATLEDSGDPDLETFCKWGEWSSVQNKDLKALEFGLTGPITTSYRMAVTTRTTSSGSKLVPSMNLQNMRRLAGVRECFVPRSGYCFGQIDISGLELGTIAQVMAWKMNARKMCELINKGVNLHMLAACQLRGWDYSEAMRHKEEKLYKDQRQFCKIANFGFNGFMAPATLVSFARQQGTHVTVAQATDLKLNWARTLPEVPYYHQWVKQYCRNHETGLWDFEIPGSPGILRAGATLTSAANGHFQGLGAQCAKQAGWELTRESWTQRNSPLFGVKIPLFTHDEWFFEIKIGEQHQVVMRAKAVIENVLHRMLPDVKLFTEFSVMSVLSKDAKMLLDDNKELMVWEPSGKS